MNLEIGRIEAVTFDAGGTLIEPQPSVGAVYADVAARFGVTGLSPEKLDGRFAHVWRDKKDFDYSRRAWFELVRETFAERAAELPDVFFPSLYQRFAEPDVWRVYDDVIPVLENLAARGLRLGVVSNWDERLRPLLHTLKLDRYFDVMIISCEVAFTKPSPVIFEHASRKIGASPQGILHIGDSVHEDFEGARLADMPSFLLRRKGPSTLHQIASLLEIEPRLFGGQL
jgi:putative hydrolase of the HAD superfamily